MSVLSTIKKPETRAPIITICGDAGTGKTSLACTFPNPIVICAEDGLMSVPADKRPDAFPLLKSADDLWPQLLALLQEDHDYRTLIVDSVSACEQLFIKDVMDRDGRAKSINQALGGYGAGAAAVAAMHQRLRKGAGLLNERKNMAVVFISHADLEAVRPPDQDDYTRYSLRLMSKSLPPYVDDVDMVAFVRLVSALRGDEGDRKKIISNGDREVICHATAASVSKNRFGITEPLDFSAGENPFARFFDLPTSKPAKAAKAKAETAQQPEAEEYNPEDFA
jgi:hypothetical protein